MPFEPDSIPPCLRAPAGSSRKPILWVVNGCGLHEMEFCSARRTTLPQIALRNFADADARASVVWQPVGGGFQMRTSRRFKGECAAIDAHQVPLNLGAISARSRRDLGAISSQVAKLETEWLSSRGVRHFNYTALAMEFAPLMFDAIHFTYYWVPCARAFPEMARLVAQLIAQQAVRRPVDVCPTAERFGRASAEMLAKGVALGPSPVKHPVAPARPAAAEPGAPDSVPGGRGTARGHHGRGLGRGHPGQWPRGYSYI